MNTLLDVKKTIRSLVGDEPGEWTSDSYLTPKINFVYRTQTLYLKNGSGANLEQVVVVPDAADGNGNSTSTNRRSLADQQQPGQLLAGLYEPLTVWWKPAGQPERFYVEMRERKTLPFAHLDAPLPGGPAYWTWMGNTLYVTPIGFPYDLLVDGRFNPPPLVKDADVLVAHPDMETTVTPKTLALIGVEAGNAGWQTAGEQQAEMSADDIVAQIIRSKQGQTARAGTNAWRLGMRGWFWA